MEILHLVASSYSTRGLANANGPWKYKYLRAWILSVIH